MPVGRIGGGQLRSDALPHVIAQIGNTPLLRLDRIAAGLSDHVVLYAKAEHLNPTGSVKDRAAARIVFEGVRSGRLHPGVTLIDATSGNTGIAYAALGARLGIPVKLAMPANASRERRLILEAHGAELVLTDPFEGTDGAQTFVKELVAAEPDRYYYPDQYNNDANWRAHFESTGPEIIEQTRGEVTHFVAALGTTGTFTGTTRRLKAFDAGIQAIAVHPSSPLHGMEGLKHLETAIVPGIYDPDLSDADVRVATEDAFEMTRRLAKEEGLLVGVSSGANVHAALQIASELKEGVVVTVLCDTGTRYLGDAFWTEDAAGSSVAAQNGAGSTTEQP